MFVYYFEMMLDRIDYLTFLVILHAASDAAATAAAHGADDILLKVPFLNIMCMCCKNGKDTKPYENDIARYPVLSIMWVLC